MFLEPILSENAIATLRARYLVKDAAGNVIETPGGMFRRVADFVAAAERKYVGDSAAAELSEQFYAMMAGGKFLPNSPTLMNAGRRLGLLSACFVLPIDDSIEGIFESVKRAAIVQKAGGGTGFSFDRLRPTGDVVASSGGRTSGPVSFWRVFCEATRAIQQGAFRRGANMAMMSIEHPDILKFITAKDDPAAFENFNVSIKITDSFMAALHREGDSPHVVTNPRTGQGFYLPAGLDIATYAIQDLIPVEAGPPERFISRRDVWNMIVRSAWAGGEPGLCFIDRVNADNPTPLLGRIEATNPCGEQPLLDYEACNLGSIDVAKCVSAGRFDEQELRRLVRLGARFLDDVIDVNNYVFPQIHEICLGNRKIGLGIMGLADAMFELGIKYDSQQGLDFARKVAQVFTAEAYAAGEDLAVQRGSFPNWTGSIWHHRERAMRNAAITTVAPTGTLSILAGCSGGIEPVFALAFYRHVMGREMLEVNAPFQRWATQRGLNEDDLARQLAAGKTLAELLPDERQAAELFVTAHQIAPSWHVKMQAVFQEYLDGAISKTINLPNSAAPADVEEVYNLAFDLKCKGITVYRDRCRAGQPMATASETNLCPQCRSPLDADTGCFRCLTCGTPLCSI